jgi:hypothetical protein
MVLHRPRGGAGRSGRLPGAGRGGGERAAGAHPGRGPGGALQRLPPPRVPTGARLRPGALRRRDPLPLPLLDLYPRRRPPDRAVPGGRRRPHQGRSLPVPRRCGHLGRVRVRPSHTGRGEGRGSLAGRPVGWSAGATAALPARRAPGRAADRVPRRRELEGPAGELQRVLPLRSGPPRALSPRARVQAAGRRGPRLGARRSPPRRGLDLHRQRDDHPRPVRGTERRRAGPSQGRADLSQPHAQPLRRPRGRLHHPASWTRPHHGAVRVPLPPGGDGQGRVRPLGCGGLLGPGQPAGLGHLRVGAAGHELARVRDRVLRADGELEPGYPEVRGGESGERDGRRTGGRAEAAGVRP